MKVRIIGAHNYASRDTRLACMVIDGRLALDAGSLATGLAFDEQARIEAVLLTHRHLDHVNDLAMLGGVAYYMGGRVDVYGTAPTLRAVEEYLFHGALFPDPRLRPSPDDPAMRLHILEEYKPTEVAGYRVLAVPGSHSVPTTGFEVTDPAGRRVFYSGDTNEGIAEVWPHIRPDLMLLECTVSNARADGPDPPRHLSARLFGEVLEEFRRQHGYIPKMVAVHLLPFDEDAVRAELPQVARQLGIEIAIAREGDVYEA
ncbi:MAG: MBL fold metallo-hydrolase [Chloroflexi bacterium]|nr:MBL fold metallo-hydrolase [Chloroflexota bacterium]